MVPPLVVEEDLAVVGFLGEGRDGAAGCEAVPGRCPTLPLLLDSGRRGSLGDVTPDPEA